MNNENYYPLITDKLLQALERDFPNELPKKQISEFELGVLIGHQQVIDKLKFEKDKVNEID